MPTWRGFWAYYEAKGSAGFRRLQRLRAASDGSSFEAPTHQEYDDAVRQCIEDEAGFERLAAADEEPA
jgi:hypothetical protein